MDKPRRPGKRAGSAEWDRYHTDMAAWRDEQRATTRHSSTQSGPYNVQHRDGDATVQVSSGFSFNHQVPTSNFIIAQPGSDEHRHLVIDDDGNEIYDQWNPNH